MTERSRLPHLAECDGVGLQRQVDLGIDVGRADRDVSEPGADSVDVHAGEDQVAAVVCRITCGVIVRSGSSGT